MAGRIILTDSGLPLRRDQVYAWSEGDRRQTVMNTRSRYSSILLYLRRELENLGAVYSVMNDLVSLNVRLRGDGGIRPLLDSVPF